MHVCHINLSAELGGGTLQTLALIEALGERIQQSLVVQRDTPLHEAVDRFDWLDTRPVANSLLAATRASAGAQLLHVHEGRSVTAAAIRSLIWGTPYVAIRGVWQPPNTGWLSRWRYERAAAVVTISTPILQAMAAYSDKLRLELIPDCVRPLEQDPEHVRELKASFAGRLVVGHVGSLQDAVKAQSLILEVARAMNRSHPQVIFWLIGDGPDASQLQAAAADLPNVSFMGWAERVADYYAAMDVFVFPSRKEGLGSSLLEAMSFGLPIVATRVGGIPDVVEQDVTGLLVDPDDAGQLRDAVVKLADSLPLRQRLGAAGARRSGDFSPEKRADRYLAVYRRILGSDASPQSQA